MRIFGLILLVLAFSVAKAENQKCAHLVKVIAQDKLKNLTVERHNDTINQFIYRKNGNIYQLVVDNCEIKHVAIYPENQKEEKSDQLKPQHFYSYKEYCLDKSSLKGICDPNNATYWVNGKEVTNRPRVPGDGNRGNFTNE